MANIAPNAILKVTPSSLTLPANTATLDGQDSWDPNENGVIMNWEFQVNGTIISSSNTQVVTATFPSAGTYSIKLIVKDKGGLVAETTKSIVVNPMPVLTTKWGALIADGTPSQRVNVINMFNGTCGRHGVNLKNWDDNDNMFDTYKNAGIKCITVLSWDTSKDKYVTANEYSAYKAQVQKYLGKYKPEVVVIENEPTTDVFFVDNIQNYINQLAFIVPVVKAFGVKVADGAIHIPFIEQCIKAGSKTLSGNPGDVQKLIAAYKNIPLDYINMHCHVDQVVVPIDFCSKAANYLRVTCKKEVMSNEWHITPGSSAAVMTSVVNAWKAAKVAYCLVYSSQPGNNEPISNAANTQLTPVGIAFKNAIV